jgi:hypothetical protein
MLLFVLNEDHTLKCLLDRMLACKGAVVDLEAETAEDIVSLLALLVGAGYVLHGSNRIDGPPVLTPRQANDLFRAAGNRRGVYATIDWIQALLHALLARADLTARLGSVTVGYRRDGDRHELRVTDDLLALMGEQDPEVWAPGLIYVLPRAPFEPLRGAASELFSPTPVPAAARLRVGVALSRIVTGDEMLHVRAYAAGELPGKV